jgi:hypothetical protein
MLVGKYLTSYDFLSVSMKEFVPMSVKSAFEARLGNVVFQLVHKRMSIGYGIVRSNIGLLRMICMRLGMAMGRVRIG